MRNLKYILLLIFIVSSAKAQIKNYYDYKLDSIVKQSCDYFDKETSEIDEKERSTTLLGSKKIKKK